MLKAKGMWVAIAAALAIAAPAAVFAQKVAPKGEDEKISEPAQTA